MWKQYKNHILEGHLCDRCKKQWSEQKKQDQVSQLYDLSMYDFCLRRSRSRSKVPEEKRRNIRKLILQFLQFFRPGRVEPFNI